MNLSTLSRLNDPFLNSSDTTLSSDSSSLSASSSSSTSVSSSSSTSSISTSVPSSFLKGDVFSRKGILDPMGILRPHNYTVLKILSLNICFFHQFIKDPSLKDRLGISPRLNQIIRMILSEKPEPDFILLQEGRDDIVQGTFISFVVKICEVVKMTPILHYNNADASSFIQATLYRSNKFFHQSSDRFYGRERSEDRNYWGDDMGKMGTGFGRQFTINTFYIKLWKEIKPGLWKEVPDYRSCPLAISNQHLGMDFRERKLQAKVVIEEMNKRYPNHHVIAAGDYNPLRTPDAGLVEQQLQIYEKAGWLRLTQSPYRTQHGITIRGSFVGFPSADPFVKSELAKKDGMLRKFQFGEPLDHGFYRPPGDKAKRKYITPDDTKWIQKLNFFSHYVAGRFDGTDQEKPTKEEDYFSADGNRENFYSDHLALSITMASEFVKEEEEKKRKKRKTQNL